MTGGSEPVLCCHPPSPCVPASHVSGAACPLQGFCWAFLSGVSEPVGALVGYLILGNGSNDLSFAIVFGLVSGMMVYIRWVGGWVGSIAKLSKGAEEGHGRFPGLRDATHAMHAARPIGRMVAVRHLTYVLLASPSSPPLPAPLRPAASRSSSPRRCATTRRTAWRPQRA